MEENFKTKITGSTYTIDRSKVLEISVQIEHFTNTLLKAGFSISKSDINSLGHSSKALSFNQKIELLIDLEGISKDAGKILVKFAEIRNKFAHVYECSTLSLYFTVYGSDTLKFLEKRFNHKIDPSENKACWQLLDMLIVDIESVFDGLLRKLASNGYKRGIELGNQKFVDIIVDRLKNDPNLDSINGENKQEIIENFFRSISEEHARAVSDETYKPPIDRLL
ncbi:hypothetical protein FAZ19_16205 [Sphingobacterium alkalisoli]|uniref:DUF4145 domain-containing protein n=1 Tax=Sphingobacterium alkalisoli TaxID=1874115 RepID=A0A4V5LXT6_9SPHI|nr:hypothetical protein [Sphingobacterium alkalisoli]TJY63809.1 hypothetical protein FAZ19_16205 [Sphingobacterium alkalisoli]GGH24747.1 hypothetical protein GCM10011418_32870 [Sphingobacterium alkalisoli]